MKFTTDKEKVLLDIIIEKIGYASKTKAREFIKGGAVMVDGEVVKIPSHVVSAGSEVQTGVKSEIKRKVKSSVEIEVLFEDDFVLVANKPPKILSSKTKRGGAPSFVEIIDNHIRTQSLNTKAAFPVNYLDSAMSGIMIFAKNSEGQKILKKSWKDAYKQYYVVCEGEWSTDHFTFKGLLKESTRGKMLYATKADKFGKEAIINGEIIKKEKGCIFAEVVPMTNVKDQERALLSLNGLTVIGDKDYMAERDSFKRMGMHLQAIKIAHPKFKSMIQVKTEVPKRIAGF